MALPATRSASLDGSVRTLVLTVADPIQYMEGRRMPRHQAEPRWIDAYQVCFTSIGDSVPSSLPTYKATDPAPPGRAPLDRCLVGVLPCKPAGN